MNEAAGFEAANLGELRFGLLENEDGDPELEARAMESFRARFRRAGDGED